MTPNLKVLAGTMLLLGFIIGYIFLAMMLAAVMLPNSGGVVQFAYYAIAGLAWVPPAGLIISWMYRR